MELTREEITETIAEMQRLLDATRETAIKHSPAWVNLWRRMMRLEEKLYKHPY